MLPEICELISKFESKSNNERLNWDEYFMSIALLAWQTYGFPHLSLQGT